MKIVLTDRLNRGRRFCFFMLFLLLLCSFLVASICILARFKPVFEEKAGYAAKMKATDIINKAADSVFENINSADLVTINKNETGQMTSVSADTIEMNRLKTKLSLSIQKFTENTEDSVIYIPIGSLTDFSVLQGTGYRIPVKIAIDGFSKIDFDDEFVNAGINQVKHKIYMTASVRISIISAVMAKSETVTAEIPVAETVIIGDVPQYYGDSLSVVGR
ncbi:MAG: sporulation protein YunB [Clostridia bacterium]|nr:sporulation protein YunB [Clostridia bacterium]